MPIVKCKTCGETDLLQSDICGNNCVYCYGDAEAELAISRAKSDSLSCSECNKSENSLTNGMCKKCHSKWESEQKPWQKRLV